MKCAIFGVHACTKKCIQYFLEHGDEVLYLHDTYQQHTFQKLQHENLRCYFYETLTDINLSKEVSAFKPDYIISYVFGKKVPQSIITKAKILAFNIHPAPLPELRSGNAWFWVIRKRLESSALTVHLLTENFDSGDIIYQHPFVLSSFDTQGIYVDRVVQVTDSLMDNLYPLLQAKKFFPEKQGEGAYYPKITLGDCCIDWSESSESLAALIRACNPFHFAITFFRDFEVKIIEAVPAFKNNGAAATMPGSICIENNTLMVATGDNWLNITILLVPGKAIFSAKHFISYFNVSTNDTFNNCELFVPEYLLKRKI